MCKISRRAGRKNRTFCSCLKNRQCLIERIMRDNITLGIMMLWVWGVSMWDHYLTIKLQHEIMLHEKNPLGLLLLGADGGSVALFMTVKMIGLWLIFFITLGLYRWRKPYGLSAMLLLSLVQLYLVLYFFHTPPL
jgi:hypothetical protein